MDRDGFELLVTELRALVFNAALAKLSPEDASDVVSETFAAVWTYRERAPEDTTDLRRWCWGIAKNKIADARRRPIRKHHDSRFVEDHMVAEPISRDDPAEQVVNADAMRRALDVLPPGEREALTAAAVTDLPGSEVAAMLGLSHTAFASRLSRAREKLARFLTTDGLILEGE